MVSDKRRIDSDLAEQVPGWNELQFVPWQSFRRMVPSIVGLEISRIGDLIEVAASVEFRNALVKVRYELELFVEQLKTSERAAVEVDTLHLASAILNIPIGSPGIEANTAATLEYILDRLKYVHGRIRFVYQ